MCNLFFYDYKTMNLIYKKKILHLLKGKVIKVILSKAGFCLAMTYEKLQDYFRMTFGLLRITF